MLDVGLLLYMRAQTSLKPRALYSHEIDLTDLHSLQSYAKYLTTRRRQHACSSCHPRGAHQVAHSIPAYFSRYCIS
jgi:hypothetical protein